MSAVLEFLYCRGTDAAGRTYLDILEADDEFWEDCHNHVQWVFPLPEPSAVQPESPVATQDDFNVIANSSLLKMRVLAALGRYLLFLDRTLRWRRDQDHNHLRVTRIIRCLTLCGLNETAFEFYDYCRLRVGVAVGNKTLWYWSEALKRHPAWLKEKA